MDVRNRTSRLERVLVQGVRLVQCSWCPLSVAPGETLFVDPENTHQRWCSVTCAREAPHRCRALVAAVR